MNNDDTTPRSLSFHRRLQWLVTQLQVPTQAAGNGADGAPERDKKRAGLIEGLITQLDIVIYCQICAVYYMDCSLWRFTLRCIPHFVLSNPPAILLFVSRLQRAYLLSTITTNLLCGLLHILVQLPEGNELSRGHVHGGYLIDFVGQPTPTSRLKLVLIDLCILALQLLLLSAVMEKRDLKLSSHDPRLVNAITDTPAQQSNQDVDAEERGVRRSQEAVEGEAVALLHNDEETDKQWSGHFLDEFYGGQVNILDVDPLLIIKKAWLSYDGIARQIRTPP